MPGAGVFAGKVSYMVGFILTGHGDYPQGLVSAAQMVVGARPLFETVSFQGAQVTGYDEELNQAIASMRERADGVLVFVDLVGGTPFNQAMLASQAIDGVEVVTGTNLPVLVELLLSRTDEATLDQLAAQAVEVGRSSIMHKVLGPIGACASCGSQDSGR